MGKEQEADGAIRPSRAFRQVSLSTDFLERLEVDAFNSGRSLAKQIEHSYLIARAIETAIPNSVITEIKTGGSPALIVERLVSFYENRGEPSDEFKSAWARSVARIRADKKVADSQKSGGSSIPLKPARGNSDANAPTKTIRKRKQSVAA